MDVNKHIESYGIYDNFPLNPKLLTGDINKPFLSTCNWDGVALEDFEVIQRSELSETPISVYKARLWTFPPQFLLLKVLLRQHDTKEELLSNMTKEAELMIKLPPHPNILRVFAYFIDYATPALLPNWDLNTELVKDKVLQSFQAFRF
eukprot:TRINITY_DN7204_c0_g1_i2.p1 TRINITY_DN7204_c0_g1~~TRINITY_DN7204_c0_g1_i2.p1  ORF type:complete len:148 (-),score=15.23 TRINITY_DN7204_c0_g1_i2:546-989(-)